MAGVTDASDEVQAVMTTHMTGRMTTRITPRMTTDELLREFTSVVPHGHARRLIGRARRVAGLDGAGEVEVLETIELLMILEAIASEGGELQMLAEVLARRTLYDDTGGRALD